MDYKAYKVLRVTRSDWCSWLAGATWFTGEAGLTGEAGAHGSEWLSGAGVPSASIGYEGDFYIRTTDQSVYKKIGGLWVEITSLKGATGAKGDTGERGERGRTGSDGGGGSGNTGREYNRGGRRGLRVRPIGYY